MTTVAQLRSRVGRLLSDEALVGYEAGLFYDALGAALDAIMPWVPKTGTHQITGDESYSYEVPTDLYEVEACVIDETGEILPHAILVPGYYRGDNLSETNDWIEYPHGYVTFSKPISTGETYTLYYLASWSKPTSSANDNDIIDAPEYTHVGLSLYAAAYMLLPSATSSAEVRQWATKVDSGNPEHNPMQRSSTYLMKMFVDEMNRHPRHQKAQK